MSAQMKIAAAAAFYIASVAVAYSVGAGLPLLVSETQKMRSDIARERGSFDELAAQVERLRQRCYSEQSY